MRVMALDLGNTRTGIAVSDPTERVATPVRTMSTADIIANGAVWRRMLEDWEPEMLVCGLPLTLSGEEGPQAASLRERAGQIASRAGLPLAFADERLSSVAAQRILREKGLTEKDMRGKVDMIAASIFLQTWLDARAVQAARDAAPSSPENEAETQQEGIQP